MQAEEPKPSTDFKGDVDKKLVGEYATNDKKMRLSLKEDGKSRMQATVGTRVGPQKIDSQLEWKVDGETISFKDTNGAISRYKFAVSAKELLLKSPKSSTTYLKEK